MSALYQTTYLLLLLSASLTSISATTPIRVNLTGDAWTLESRDYPLNVSDVKATVPGQVHLDLL